MYYGPPAVSSLLYIPWFRPDAWNVPTLYAIGALLLLTGLSALHPKWREQAPNTAVFLGILGGAAYLFGYETIPVQPFGVLVATGVLLGTRYGEWFAQHKHGINPAYISDFATHVVVIGFISCYILNGLFYETDKFMEVLRDPRKIFTTWLGLSSYGGFFGAIFGVWVWKKRRNLPALQVADITCFALPLGWFFGRLGCFVVHDHPGAITTFPLAVENYPPPDPVTGQLMARHDLGLYEVFWSAAVIILFWVLRNKTKPIGWHTAVLPVLYAPVRFFLDYLRIEGTEHSDVRWAGLTPGQYSSILMLFIGLVMFWYIKNHEATPMPAECQWPPPEKDGEEDAGAKGAKAKKKA